MIAKQVLSNRMKDLERREAENSVLQRQISECESRIRGYLEKLSVAQDALVFLTDLANGRRGNIRGRVESVVTEAVRLLYGNEYRVELVYSVKNNRSCLDIEMVRDTVSGEVRRSMDGFGGGLADVISVPLRLLTIMSARGVSRVCVLDECYRHLDQERVEMIGEFLRMLADKLGIQIIMVTHHEALKAKCDKLYELRDDGGRVRVSAKGNS